LKLFLDSPEGDIDFRSENVILGIQEKFLKIMDLSNFHFDNNDLSYYVKEILYYIDGNIVRSIIKVIVCQNCTNILIENRLDNEYSKNVHLLLVEVY
jgi:hypothetical protein